MTRKDFLEKAVAIGVGIPIAPILLDSCSSGSYINTPFQSNFKGRVTIIGAGAAGLIAGYILSQNNIDFQIIEASCSFGGRIKRNNDFADFPIDLGAEWIHTNPNILEKLANNSIVNQEIELIKYSPNSVFIWKKKKLRKRNWVSNFYKEYKFKSTTWYGYFDKYIIPEIKDKIVYNSPVKEINYKGEKVIVKNEIGNVFPSDKVLVTVPIKVLQENIIEFTPKFSNEKINAINSVLMPDGIKVFIEFSEKFYPDMLFTGNLLNEIGSSEKLFYNAAFKKESERNILGFFCVGGKASSYTSLGSDEKIIEKLLEELDLMFAGKASKTFQKYLIQNWSKEPYVMGSYSIEFTNNRRDTINELNKSISDKVYFAGEALSFANGSTVHGAGESAYYAVKLILNQKNNRP